MAYATISTYDEVLKTFYLPGIQEYLNNANVLANIVEKNEKDVAGKNATIQCHYGRSTGTKWTTDGGTLPTATYQKFKTCTVPMKYGYGTIRVTGPTIRATRDEQGAYAKALDTEIKGIVEDYKKEVNRQMFGCGLGILARWLSGSGTTIVVQKKYRGNSAGGDCFGSTFGSKYLDKRSDAVSVVGSTFAGAGTFVVDDTDIAVSAVTRGAESDSLTCSDSGTTEVAGSVYVRPGALGTQAASSAHRLEMMGLRGLVTDENLDNIYPNDGSGATGGGASGFPDYLQGLAVATYPWFKAIVDSHGSGRYAGQRALTLELMQTMFDMIEETVGKDYGPNLIMTTRAIRREYLELVRADRGFVNTMELDGGWTGLDYNGIPLTVDNDAIDGEMYFLTTKDLQIFRMSDYDWMKDSAGAIVRPITGYDAYEAVLFRYAEFGVINRAGQGVITDLSYSKGTNEGYGG